LGVDSLKARSGGPRADHEGRDVLTGGGFRKGTSRIAPSARIAQNGRRTARGVKAARESVGGRNVAENANQGQEGASAEVEVIDGRADNPMDGGIVHMARAGGLCGAMNRQGEPCTRLGTGAGGRCHYHGGASHPGGLGHPRIKEGRYSKVIPKRLRERYEEAANDPQLLSSREDVAFLEARIGELSKRLYSGESDRVWHDLRRTFREWDALRQQAISARQANDPDRASAAELKAAELYGEVKRLIGIGASDAETWRELVKTLENKTKLARTEWKRLVDLRQLITVEQAMLFAHQLLSAVVRHVDDPGVRARINRDFQSALEAGGPASMTGEIPEGG
jgi:hypothetical protein